MFLLVEGTKTKYNDQTSVLENRYFVLTNIVSYIKWYNDIQH